MPTVKKNKLTNISVNVLVIPAKFPDASGHSAIVRVPCRIMNKNTRYFISPNFFVRKNFSDVSGLIQSLYTLPLLCSVLRVKQFRRVAIPSSYDPLNNLFIAFTRVILNNYRFKNMFLEE